VTKVVVINAVYPPEPVVSAYIGSDLAHHMADRGSRVTVLCPYPTRPLGASYPGFERPRNPRVEREGRVDVVRLPSFTAPRSRLLPRVRESFSFGLHAFRYLEQHLSDADVVYANSWPLLSQSAVAGWCSRHRIPLVLHVQDLYPESLLTRLPAPLAGIAGVPLTAIDRWNARRATSLVAIGDNMHRIYVESRGVPRERVITICNWQDEARFLDLPSRESVCARYGVPADRFTFMYLGNIGPVAGIELLITAFARASLTGAQLLIAGDGSRKQACLSLVQQLHLTSVQFLACPTPFDAPILQQMADICLLPMRRGAGMSSVPSKLTAYLLSAKPVLATVDAGSDTASCIRSVQCGWIGQPDDERWLAEKMADLTVLAPEVLHLTGERGRAYALKQFSKGENVARLAGIVEAAARLHSAAV
jgi:glycosyltransferase involved in cell wall biosynthesis